MLALEHRELLLLVERDLIVGISGDPWVLKGGRGVVAKRWWIGTEIQEEVFGEWCEVCRELPYYWITLNVFQFFIIILVTRLVAWV